MDYWRSQYLLPGIANKKKIALVGIGDNPKYWQDISLEQLAECWDPARLATGSAEYCVYDVDPSLIDKASARGINARVCDLTLSALPEEYELIFAADVIEHVSNPLAFLCNLKNSLTKDGRIVLTTPNALYWRNFLFGFRHEHPEHFFCFSEVHFKNIAVASGLKLDSSRSFQSVGELTALRRYLLPLHRVFALCGRGNSIVACFQQESSSTP